MDAVEIAVSQMPDGASDEDIVIMISEILPRTMRVADFKTICENFFPEGSKIGLYGDGTITIVPPLDSFEVPDDWTLAEIDSMMVKH